MMKVTKEEEKVNNKNNFIKKIQENYAICDNSITTINFENKYPKYSNDIPTSLYPQAQIIYTDSNTNLKNNHHEERQWLECGKFFIKDNKFLIECCFCKNGFGDTERFIQHILNVHINNYNQNEISNKIESDNIKFNDETSNIYKSSIMKEYTNKNDKLLEKNKELIAKNNNYLNSEDNENKQNIFEADIPTSKRNPNDGLFHCTKCSKIVKRFDLLKDHFFLKHTWHYKLENENDVPLLPANEKDPYDKKYHCTACLSSKGTYKALLRHFRNHLGTNIIDDKPFKCSSCISNFWTEQELKIHELIHSQERPREFKCEKCSKIFPRKIELNRHINMTHHKHKPYSCSYCPKKFPSKCNKDAHEMLHSNSRPHLCETCGSAHVSRAKLEYHMRRHTGERRYKCQQCEKAFFDSKRLKDHLPVHTGEKNESCDICQKMFSTRKQMMKHRKIHSDKKSYFCKICGEGFKQDSSLYRHKKHVHKFLFL